MLTGGCPLRSVPGRNRTQCQGRGAGQTSVVAASRGDGRSRFRRGSGPGNRVRCGVKAIESAIRQPEETKEVIVKPALGVVRRLLTPIAKRALLTWERLESGISLVSEPEFRNQIVLRGVEDLWIEVDKVPARHSGDSKSV